jgi:hypothetical protein
MSQRQLRRLAALEGAEKWRFETERERTVLQATAATPTRRAAEQSRDPDDPSQVS